MNIKYPRRRSLPPDKTPIGGNNGASSPAAKAIDFTKPRPSIGEVWRKPWLVHWATEETLDRLPFTAKLTAQ